MAEKNQGFMVNGSPAITVFPETAAQLCIKCVKCKSVHRINSITSPKNKGVCPAENKHGACESESFITHTGAAWTYQEPEAIEWTDDFKEAAAKFIDFCTGEGRKVIMKDAINYLKDNWPAGRVSKKTVEALKDELEAAKAKIAEYERAMSGHKSGARIAQ